MRTWILVATLAVMLGAGLFVAAPATPAHAQYGAVHCLRYGETLSGVARMYGTTAWAIAQYNGIPNPNYVRAGTCLRIPYGHPPVPGPCYRCPPPVPVTPCYGCHAAGRYCVRYGDTLFSIGARFGVSPWSIASANGLSNPNFIRGGQCLVIPAH